MGSFQKVRAHLCLDVQGSLTSLGVKVKQRSSSKWWSVLCPFCEDKSGSCSIAADSMHLNCNQCQEKLDLFKWWGKLGGHATDWDACKDLANTFNITLLEGKRTTRPRNMSPKLVKQITHDLCELEEAEGMRKFLESRGLWDPQMLETYGIGFLNGQLVFTQRTEHGELMDRSRLFRPGKWAWTKGTGIAKAVYPTWMQPPEGEDVWLLEGEWDVLVAREKLFLHAYNWTAPQSPIDPGLVPSWIKGRVVHVCYDNDTFQTPGDDLYAPDQNKRKGLERRRKNLIHGIGDRLRQFGCTVILHVIPIAPTEHWGADFRDWYEGGGRDTSDLKGYPLEEVLSEKPKAKTVSFHEVFDQPFGQRVTFNCQLNTIDVAGIVVPTYTQIQCSVGQFSYCDRCAVPNEFPDMGIVWEHRQEDLAFVLKARDPEREIITRVLQKPPTCNTYRLRATEHYSGYRWTAIEQEVRHCDVIGNLDPGDRTKVLTIISSDRPSVSSSMLVTGTIYCVKDRHVMLADRVQAVDDSKAVNIKDHSYNLQELCPWGTEKTEVIDEFMKTSAADLAANVTHINEREAIHIAVMLAYHSALFINWNKRAHRGFLDVGIIGETRTGKSVVVRALRDFFDVGQFLVGGENMSRVGLTAGIAKDGNIQAGLFPRHHGKLLCIDELHKYGRDGNLMGSLLGPRDIGVLDVTKINGGTFPAACRFILIGNTIKPIEDYAYQCQHFLDIYGSPESLSRMDFGVFVQGDVETTPPERPHLWGQELAHATIMRAWAMRADDIHISEAAEKLIRQFATDWRDLFSEEVPLFTSGEKSFSLRRIAVAVANCTFAHPEGKLGVCEVRPCHVEWAAAWLLRFWESVSYPAFSMSARQKSEEIHTPQNVEALLMKAGSRDPWQAVNLLKSLFGEVPPRLLQALLCKDQRDTDTWIGQLLSRNAAYYNGTMVRLTKACQKMVRNMIWMAEEYPDEFIVRHDRVTDVATKGALDLSLEDHVRRLREGSSVYGSTETNVIPIDSRP